MAHSDDQAADAAQPRAIAYYRHPVQDCQAKWIPIQRDHIREWAEKNAVEITDEFVDPGKSGLTAEGPQPL